MWTMLNYFGKTSFTRLTTKPTKSKRRCTTLDSPKLAFTTSLLKTRHSPGETRWDSTPPRMSYLIKHLKICLTKMETQIYGRYTSLIYGPSLEYEGNQRYKITLVLLHALHLLRSAKVQEVASPKTQSVPSFTNEEPTRKSKRVKRPTKKSTKAPARDDEEKLKDELVKIPSNDSDDEDETKITDKGEGDEDEEMDYTTSQLYDDKTKVVVTSSSHSSDLAAKFLNFSNIPHTDAEIVSPMDVHVHHEVPSKQTSSLLITYIITALEKEVTELKKDPLHTQVTTLDDDHLDARLVATRDEFMYHLSSSINARVTKQVKIQLPQILPKEVSNFAPPVIQSMVTESLEHAVLAKESSQPQSSYEPAATLTEFELKKILIDKMDKSESYLVAPEHRECYEGLSEEPEFEVADSDMPQDQEENPGNDDENPKEKVASKRGWFTKPTQPQEPTDLDWNVGKTPQQGQNQSCIPLIPIVE
ncbi:hypothetical protein Tco_1213850 [Tanacetum coccineum]